MKLELDCIRDTLLTLEENLNFPRSWTIGDLHEALPQYSTEQLKYTCIKLYEGGYLNVDFSEPPTASNHGFKHILSLTFKGHEFIETIRPQPVYEKSKNILQNVGTKSVELMSNVATNFLTTLISSQLN